MERLLEVPSAISSSEEGDIKKSAFENLKTLLRSATSSMTSVPKPMKHLCKYLPLLRAMFSKTPILQSEIDKIVLNKPSTSKSMSDQAAATDMAIEEPTIMPRLDDDCLALCADILSVMSMAYGLENHQEALFYKYSCDMIRAKGNAGPQEVSFWGHEYVRHLSMDIMHEFAMSSHIMEKPEGLSRPLIPVSVLQKLAVEILPFFIKHNAEADAMDLALELDLFDPYLYDMIDKDNYPRLTLYLSQFCAFEENSLYKVKFLDFLFRVYVKVEDVDKAFFIALKMNNFALAYEIFVSCSSPLKRQQFAFILGRCRLTVLPEEVAAKLPPQELDTLKKILSNEWFSKEFRYLAKEEFKVEQPKVPEDVFKSHLVESPFGRLGGLMSGASNGSDTWKQHLANAFVNGLLNLAHSSEKLLFKDDINNPESTNGASDLYKNKDAQLSAAIASLGMIYMWNLEDGMGFLDRYLGSDDKFIKSGALVGLGVLSCNIRDESEPAFALISDALDDDEPLIKINAILALGIAYAGTRKFEVREILLQSIGFSMEESGLLTSLAAALSCGLVFTGSADGEILSAFMQLFMEIPSEVLQSNPAMARLLYMSFGLLFFGVEDTEMSKPIETILETIQVLSDDMKSALSFIVRMMSLVASGNVLFVQECLKMFDSIHSKTEDTEMVSDDQKDQPKKEQVLDIHYFAMFGLALMPLGEDISTEMSFRLLQHCINYLPNDLRAMVPICLSLLNMSYPSTKLIDLLSKYSHDACPKMAQMSILALGLIGLGTNQSKIASLLRDLWKYYGKEANGNHLFFIRLAYGFLSASKGLISGSVLFHNRQLVDRTAVASMLLFSTALLGDSDWWMEKLPTIFYVLTPLFTPRTLVTLRGENNSVFLENGELNHQSVDVRVGHPIDVVGQAGRPKTITGFQTHTAPVLLAFDERAELASDMYVPLTDVLEGMVILEKNPNIMQVSDP